MRYAIALASLVAAVTVAVPSFAAQEPAAHGAHARRHGSFPMTGPAFKQHIDAKVAKARTAMEARAQKASADQAKEMRTKFDAGVVRVNQEVSAAIADGTVTAEEAHKVRAAMHGMRGGRHHKKA